MNKVIIMGRLTKQPEVQTTQGGNPICRFSIAVDTGYGENKHTSFFNCVAFKKTAENIAQYFSKGQRILLDGSIKQNVWDKDGVKQYSVEIMVFSFDFIEAKDKTNTTLSSSEVGLNTVSPDEQTEVPTVNPFSDSDIPF